MAKKPSHRLEHGRAEFSVSIGYGKDVPAKKSRPGEERAKTKGEFRDRLYSLGLDYQVYVNRRNKAVDPRTRENWDRRVRAVLDEIRALEERQQLQGKGSVKLTKDLSRKVWELFKSGWSVQGIARELGLTVPQVDTIVCADPPSFSEREYEFDLTQSWSGDYLIIRSADDEPDTITWIEHHDRLVKEWFDGERALVEEFYPSAPTPVRKRRTVPPETRAVWSILVGVFGTLAVLQFTIGATAVGCANLVFALALGLVLIRSR